MPAFHISRSITIESDPITVFQTIRDFKTWPTWSPWLLCEPECKVEYQGETAEVGGGYSWDGQVVGAGEMEHSKLAPPESKSSSGEMHCELRFIRPWKSESKVDFFVKPIGGDGEQTEVTWDMSGSLPFFLFWMKSMMIGFISMDYDRGLRMLKELIETGGIQSKTIVNGVTEIRPCSGACLSDNATLKTVGDSMGKTMSGVTSQLKRAGTETSGTWMSLYDHLDVKTQSVHYMTGMQLPEGASVPSGLEPFRIDPGRAMHVTHIGPYEHLGNAWAAAHQHLRAKKYKPAKRPGFEIYVNDAADTPADELRTEVYIPIK